MIGFAFAFRQTTFSEVDLYRCKKQKNLTSLREIFCMEYFTVVRSAPLLHYSKFITLPVLYITCSSTEDQAQDEQNQEDEEQNLRNTSRTGCNTTEAENGCDNGNN